LPDLVFKDSQNNVVWNPNSTYFVNEIAFLNEHGYLENFIFDGEAFICNNEGKTYKGFTLAALCAMSRYQKRLRLECRGRGICPCWYPRPASSFLEDNHSLGSAAGM
jgi:hypothetical protein